MVVKTNYSLELSAYNNSCDIFVIGIRLSDSASTLNNKRTIQLMDCPTLSMSFVSSPFAMRGVSGIFGSAFVLVLFDEVER